MVSVGTGNVVLPALTRGFDLPAARRTGNNGLFTFIILYYYLSMTVITQEIQEACAAYVERYCQIHQLRPARLRDAPLVEAQEGELTDTPAWPPDGESWQKTLRWLAAALEAALRYVPIVRVEGVRRIENEWVVSGFGDTTLKAVFEEHGIDPKAVLTFSAFEPNVVYLREAKDGKQYRLEQDKAPEEFIDEKRPWNAFIASRVATSSLATPHA